MIARPDFKFIPLAALIPIVILLEGFISIAAEILTIRQLLPVAGSSVIVTSLIIGIFLLFLALGYQRGGVTLQNPESLLLRNFLIAATWFSIGLSYFFIDFFFYYFQILISDHVVYPLLAYLLFIIAPLIFLLGQTVPITMNVVQQERRAGHIGGNTMSLSTIGSFLGATATTLICMRYFGVAATVTFNVILLLTLVLLLSPQALLIRHIFLSAIILVIAIGMNIIPENKIFVSTNNYGNYQILETKSYPFHEKNKILIINNALSSYTNKNLKGFPYIEFIKNILFNDMHIRNADILILGAGGFSISAESTYNNRFVYVDIDDNIKNITLKSFSSRVNGKFIADDARHFLKFSKQQFDVIVSDTFSNVRAIPAHLLTIEYMHTLRSKLLDNGVAIFNIIADPALKDPYSKRIDNTIRAAFQHCMVTPLHYNGPISNIIYVCRNLASLNDHQVYVDNLNNSTTDSFVW